MASSALALANAASKIQTVADVRAAMGAVTLTLSRAYALLPEITEVANLQQEAKSLLDKVNDTATKLYNVYTADPDLQDEDISAWHAHVAGMVIADANDAFKLVEQATSITFDIASIVNDALVVVGHTTGNAVESVTNALSAGATAFVWSAKKTLFLVGVGALIYFNRDAILAALKKGAKV